MNLQENFCLLKFKPTSWMAPYLQSVAGEVRLFVSPNALGSHDQNHDSENKEHREPDFTQAGGVTVYSSQLSVQSGPRHPERGALKLI